MKTGMVQNNGIPKNQTNFKGVKLISNDPAAVEKFEKLLGQLNGVDEFKSPNLKLKLGASGITTRLEKLFGSKESYVQKEDISFESLKESLLGLIKK